MVRDEELNRLIRYAQGMGLSVRFKPYVKGSRTAAEWATDGTEIVIYVTSGESKLDKILSLIHELGHHKGWVNNNRQTDPKVDAALEDEENKKMHRKRILKYETEDTQYWDEIYRDTNCTFGENKLNRQKEFDIWCYEVYCERGKLPNKKEKQDKRNELTRKWK